MQKGAVQFAQEPFENIPQSSYSIGFDLAEISCALQA
jgi:hypothetical protein